MSTSTIDVGALPPNAQKILDPNGPAPLKGMAAKGLAPGLKPGEIIAATNTFPLKAELLKGQTED